MLCVELFELHQAPVNSEWLTGLEAMKELLKLEKNINNELLKLHKLSEEENDPQVTEQQMF